MVLTRSEARDLMDRHGITPSRALGQNFLVDPNLVNRIARTAGVGPGDKVIEVGGGLGCLTLALAETGAAVTALEIDRYLIPILEEVTAAHDVRVVHDDATTINWHELLGGAASDDGGAASSAAGSPDSDAGAATDSGSGSGELAGVVGVTGVEAAGWTMVANLPYNVGTDIVLDVLDQVPEVSKLLVMVQTEVADRLTAEPGTRAAGIPSVKVAYWATARAVMTVGPDVFLPRPKVSSSVVEIVRRPELTVSVNPEVMFRLVRAGFGQRRKMLRRSLAGKVEAETFEASGVSGELRPEQLMLEQWADLANAVEDATTAARSDR